MGRWARGKDARVDEMKAAEVGGGVEAR